MVAIGKHCCRSLLSFAMDPEDRHLRGNSFFMYRQLFFTCAFHEPPSGIQVSLTHSLTVAILPPERLSRRIPAWNMRGPRIRGRPAYTWETALQKYSIWKGFDNWIVEAAARERWMLMKRDFVVFTLYNR